MLINQGIESVVTAVEDNRLKDGAIPPVLIEATPLYDDLIFAGLLAAVLVFLR